MRLLVVFVLVISNAFVLAGCGRGSPAPAPTNVTVVPGDGIVTIS